MSHDSDIGFLHSVETGAAVDGPGMRLVYFMAGCQFRCLYCHNPDTWKPHAGRRLSVDEALAEAAPYAGFLRVAGGVTISGGEPLVQAPFVGRLLARLKGELGLHTALDTQGFLHDHVDDAWLAPVDLVLLDIKHTDAGAYHRLTGQDLQPTLDFAHRLARLGKAMRIRHVVVPGLTDDCGHLERLAELAAGLGPAVTGVELLPLHHLGDHKWAALGLDYPLAATPVPTAEQMARARAPFAARGLAVA